MWIVPSIGKVPVISVPADRFHIIAVVHEVYRLGGKFDNLLGSIRRSRLALKFEVSKDRFRIYSSMAVHICERIIVCIEGFARAASWQLCHQSNKRIQALATENTPTHRNDQVIRGRH